MARKTNSEKIDELQKVVVRLETKINNGISEDIKEIKEAIRELNQKFGNFSSLKTQVRIQWWFITAIAIALISLTVRSLL